LGSEALSAIPCPDEKGASEEQQKSEDYDTFIDIYADSKIYIPVAMEAANTETTTRSRVKAFILST
jgi:uncharacterized protein YciU (UPF0263 family)